jgi:hypothetical protein
MELWRGGGLQMSFLICVLLKKPLNEILANRPELAYHKRYDMQHNMRTATFVSTVRNKYISPAAAGY